MGKFGIQKRLLETRGKTMTQFKIEDFELIMGSIYEYIGNREFTNNGRRYLLDGKRVNLTLMAKNCKAKVDDRLQYMKSLKIFKKELINISKFKNV